MACRFHARRTIEFADTDMAGIVHFSHFFRYMEAIEHEFFRSLGFLLHRHDDEGMLGWARVHAECDYSKPLSYANVLDIELLVTEKTAKSLSYAFIFRKEEPAGSGLLHEVARGRLKVVCVRKKHGEEKMRAVQIPSDIDRAIEVAPIAS